MATGQSPPAYRELPLRLPTWLYQLPGRGGCDARCFASTASLDPPLHISSPPPTRGDSGRHEMNCPLPGEVAARRAVAGGVSPALPRTLPVGHWSCHTQALPLPYHFCI